MKTIQKGLCILLVASPFFVFAQDTDGKKQLENLKSEIRKIESAIYKDRKKLSSEQKSLHKIESKLGKTNAEIRALNKKISSNTKRISELENNQSVLEEKKLAQEKLLEKSLQTAYQHGRQEQMKLLLNREEPEKLGRTLAYMDYVNQARQKQLDDYQATLQQIADEAAESQKLKDELEDKQQALAEVRNELDKQKKQRDNVLASIRKNISGKTKQLAEKQAEEKRLQKLISDLAAAARKSQVRKFTFDKQSGQCRLPVNGKQLSRYKQWRPGGTRWEGIKIAASHGTEVKAVAPGTVVFADWFGSHGLLLILDHGNGYMSLYAHNQSLLKGVGNVVIAGDTIATVGNSGGLQDSALYFEVRKNGSTVDPLKWCK